jgi:plasmid maintenance system antidote protein VapI
MGIGLEIEFASLLELTRIRAQTSVQNGEVSVRGLAARVRVSQPHLHKVLKGERPMSPDLADRLLPSLGVCAGDLIEQARARALRKQAGRETKGVRQDPERDAIAS